MIEEMLNTGIDLLDKSISLFLVVLMLWAGYKLGIKFIDGYLKLIEKKDLSFITEVKVISGEVKKETRINQEILEEGKTSHEDLKKIIKNNHTEVLEILEKLHAKNKK